MVQPAIDTSFETTIQDYISWASEWDGDLPADVFFGVWADLQREKSLPAPTHTPSTPGASH